MKKLLMNFADSLLSREQMKKVKGGYDVDGSCTHTLTCSPINKSCTSQTGNCKSSSQYATTPWIECDGTRYTCN